MKQILGRKVGMTQLFDAESGGAVPVTVIQAGPCRVTAVKNQAEHGYDAVQIGYEEIPAHKLSGGERGHLVQAGLPALRHLREVRLGSPAEAARGDEITVAVFSEGDKVDVTGVSKGKGFAGAVKRYGFAGGPKTHGQSDRHRAPGSRGAGTTPGRTFKGSRGPGRMGNDRTTLHNLRVVLVDAEKHLLAVKGAVPGPADGLVTIRGAVKV